MAATSVTGRGPGMSNGSWKPKNQCGGCGGCGEDTPSTPSTPPKRGCVTNVTTGGSKSYQTGGSTSVKVC